MIRGEDDDDLIWGDDGNDSLYGDDGDDQIDGGEGADSLHGGEGDDVLIDRSASSSDRLPGGDGDDILDCFDNPYANFDDAEGGAGNDTFFVDDADDYPDWTGVPPEALTVDSSNFNLSIANKPGVSP